MLTERRDDPSPAHARLQLDPPIEFRKTQGKGQGLQEQLPLRVDLRHPAMGTPMDFYLRKVLGDEQILPQAVQFPIGKEFLEAVGSFRSPGEDLGDQAGALPIMAFPIRGVAGDQRIRVIETLLAGGGDPHLHVADEDLTAIRQPVGEDASQVEGDEPMPIARTDHGIDLSIQVFVADLTVLLAPEIVFH